eukprot:CAMPEP_0185689188 /NCGR_PEP_ID=MMETSP1164-20130828/310_1 /TAXON_ID=1104430 /ORGANISM="Chrysoreinhardia sp, Strain CCMP2950" /LENGTH=314 /DNA_ID=CAMNT_0028355675 /DNA_START=372 /DNA_END=1316 /DNA_ORIENTATION=+
MQFCRLQMSHDTGSEDDILSPLTHTHAFFQGVAQAFRKEAETLRSTFASGEVFFHDILASRGKLPPCVYVQGHRNRPSIQNTSATPTGRFLNAGRVLTIQVMTPCGKKGEAQLACTGGKRETEASVISWCLYSCMQLEALQSFTDGGRPRQSHQLSRCAAPFLLLFVSNNYMLFQTAGQSIVRVQLCSKCTSFEGAEPMQTVCRAALFRAAHIKFNKSLPDVSMTHGILEQVISACHHELLCQGLGKALKVRGFSLAWKARPFVYGPQTSAVTAQFSTGAISVIASKSGFVDVQKCTRKWRFKTLQAFLQGLKA